MSIEYRGEKFEGYNKPKKTPKHPTKSHDVLAKDVDQERIGLIRLSGKSQYNITYLSSSQHHLTQSENRC